MHFLTMQIAGGRTFFIGLLLTVAACALASRCTRRASGISLSVASIIGGIFVLISSPPLSWWVHAAWLLSLGACVVASETRDWRGGSVHGMALGGLSVVSLGMLLGELPYHRAHALPFPHDRALVVLGDSLSMALETGVAPWPVQVGEATGLEVINRAAGGKRTQDAADQAPDVVATDASVLIEIGGNDMLAGVPSRDYAAALESLLSTVCTPGRTVAMFELPLVPFHNGYGRAQRQGAKDHGVILIPKGVLTSVLADKACTVDGLHLSGRGHRKLAELVAELVE